MACPTNKVVHTFASATAAAKRARRRNGLKRPVKTIYDNHQLRFT